MERYTSVFHSVPHLLIPGTEINLAELQKTLDAQGIEIVENQKESVVGRKALAERTKGKTSIGLFQLSPHRLPLRIQENP